MGADIECMDAGKQSGRETFLTKGKRAIEEKYEAKLGSQNKRRYFLYGGHVTKVLIDFE